MVRCLLISSVQKLQTCDFCGFVVFLKEFNMKRKCEFDEETVECPLCNELLSPPIHQCQNGHMGCRACCEKLKGKECPTCRAMPFAHSRCLGLEKIVESLRTTCLYAAEGCTEMMKLSERDKHAKEACEYRQLKCPVPTCSYTGPKREVPEHFKSVHHAEVARCAPGNRSRKFIISWIPEWANYILVVVDKELFLADIHYASLVSIPIEKCEYQHAAIMFCCSSFGTDSLKYNLELTVKSKEGVSSTSRLDNALAFNNQMTGDIGKDRNHLLLLPTVNPSPQIKFKLTIL